MMLNPNPAINPASITTGCLVTILLILLYKVIYRIFFHPLRSVPGPWMNKVSELPAAFNLLKGNQHIYYMRLHESYGAVVRVSPSEVSFISTEAREEIYGHRKLGLMEKSPIFLGAVGSVDGHVGVSLAMNEEHTRQRRALGHMFTNNALLQLEDLMQVHVRKFVTVLRRKSIDNHIVNVSEWYTFLMFDIIGELCFAEPFGCLDQGSATNWSTSVINVFIAATYTQAIRRLSGVNTWFERFMTYLLIPRKYAKWTTLHLENSRRKTSHRLAEADREHTDFIYQILNRGSKSQLTETEVYLNIALFISAGTDTTATALTGWTYFMCTHRNACKRAADEVRNSIRTSDDIVWENVKGLQYLSATINEALRLYAPSPASQQRIVPPGGALIDGYWLPAGTTVAVSPWSSTHSELNFYDPGGFWPERWLGESNFANDHLSASVPFGNGPRVCIGKNLAHMELRVVAAHMLWNFDFELDRGEFQAENSVWGFDGFMKPMKVFHSMTKPPLWVRFEPKNLQ